MNRWFIDYSLFTFTLYKIHVDVNYYFTFKCLWLKDRDWKLHEFKLSRFRCSRSKARVLLSVRRWNSWDFTTSFPRGGNLKTLSAMCTRLFHVSSFNLREISALPSCKETTRPKPSEMTCREEMHVRKHNASAISVSLYTFTSISINVN